MILKRLSSNLALELSRKYCNNSHWTLADYNLLHAIESENIFESGWKRKIIKYILHFANFRLIQYSMLIVYGILAATRLWIISYYKANKFYINNDALKDVHTVNIFVKFGARSLSIISKNYEQNSYYPVINIEDGNIGSMSQYGQVRYLDLIMTVIRAFKNALKIYDRLPSYLTKYRLDWITFGFARIAIYSFTKLFWENLNQRLIIHEVCFMNSDTSAFAAADAGVTTVYHSHGLVSRGIIFARFAKVNVMTRSESRWVRNFLPLAKIESRIPATIHRQLGEQRQRTVIIVSQLKSISDISFYKNLFLYFINNNYRVYIRPSPRDERFNSESFWISLLDQIKLSVDIASTQSSFDLVISTLRPTFLVATDSSTLVDALYNGVVPVTLGRDGDRSFTETVYPILDCCLSWELDREMIVKIMTGDVDCCSIIEALLECESRINL
jgi:hypothetical protein